MNFSNFTFCSAIAAALMLFSFCSSDAEASSDVTLEDPTDSSNLRDPLLQPFSSESIWNMPIGDEAEYVHAQLCVPTEGMINIDEDYIIMTPDEPLVDLKYSSAGWNREMDRCVKDADDTVIAQLPIDKDWIVSKDLWDGNVPNAGVAVLMADKRYIYQGQPYAHCTADGDYTVKYSTNRDPDIEGGYADIYGDGIYGAHGGSKLSCIGGTLRAHELTPTSGPINHVLKVNVWGAMNLYYDQATGIGYTWPATAHDACASNDYDGEGYGTHRPADVEVVEECVMGALLALKPDFDIEGSLTTEPAKILAQAFMDYGAYIVDNTGWDVFALITEWGTNGRFTDNFEANWGFKFKDTDQTSSESSWSEWAIDIRTIYSNLHVVVNNSNTNRGGPGERRVAKAAAIQKL